jgi:DNA-binding SARP family transcriptional activator/tetratricopeptide (TPR) repeat protein
LRLRTIGGLWIEGDGAPSQAPRPLGLLALVAAAGSRGVSRDRVIGILWAETGEEQARHTLSQTIYSLRRAAGRDLITGTTQLRLDPSLPSDVGELRRALEAGELETAARLYTGKFLEGFYLPGAPEFERWVEEERSALEREARLAIERLARQSDEAGRPVEAVRWWQRLTELDPLSARYTLGHMRALAAAGDGSVALAAARRYRETVRRELNAEPDPAIGALEQSLRAASPSPTSPPPFVPAPAVTASERFGVSEVASAPVAPGREASIAPSPTRRLRWLVPVALVAVAGIALVVRGFGNKSTGDLPFLAVGEIRIEGTTDSTLSGRVLRDMLATSLGAIEGLQVVANSRLVELMPRGLDIVPGAINDAARRAGATEVIEGELSNEPGGLLLSLRRVSAARGVVRKGYVVRAANRSALVDSATAAIARDLKLTPPSVTVAQIRTSSPAAYALFDEGLRAAYGYDGPAGSRLMKAALARDSNFAMAAYYVWHLAHTSHDDSTATRVLPLVKRLALRSIERERLLIQANVAAQEAPTPMAAALAETLTVKFPDDPDGQILLGQVRHTQGDFAGSVAALERAVFLDSTAGALSGPYCRVCSALALMSLSYTWWDSLAAAERTARRLIALRPDDTGPSGSPSSNLVEVLLRLGRRAEVEELLSRTASEALLGSALLQRDLIRWGKYERVDRELIEQITSRNVARRSDAWWLLLLSLRDQGRLREADTLIHRSRVPNTTIRLPDPGPEPVDVALLALEMGRPEISIRAHRENVAAIVHWTGSPAFLARNTIWQLTLAATAHVAAGDTAVVRRLADSVETMGLGSYFAGRDARLHYFLRGLLLQREGRHGEAVDAFRRSLYSLTDGYTRTNLMMARSLLELHRPTEAIAVLRPAIHGGVDGSNTYVSRTELHEALAEAFEQAGQRDSAVVHWRAVESAWRRADPQFKDRYLQAKLKAGL